MKICVSVASGSLDAQLDPKEAAGNPKRDDILNG